MESNFILEGIGDLSGQPNNSSTNWWKSLHVFLLHINQSIKIRNQPHKRCLQYHCSFLETYKDLCLPHHHLCWAVAVNCRRRPCQTKSVHCWGSQPPEDRYPKVEGSQMIVVNLHKKPSDTDLWRDNHITFKKCKFFFDSPHFVNYNNNFLKISNLSLVSSAWFCSNLLLLVGPYTTRHGQLEH